MRLLLLLCLLCLAVPACGGSNPSSPSPSPSPSPAPAPSPSPGAGPVSPAGHAWQSDGSAWAFTRSGTPPACPSPIVLRPPVDLDLVTSILYPGQRRGGDYKPHGGFALDRAGQTNEVTVVAPFDGMVYRGARYIEGGRLQILIDVLHECGIAYRFDHLAQLSPRFQAIADSWTVREDTRTTGVDPGQTVTAGEPIATAIGVPGNAAFDFGVYDLRQRNNSAAPPGEYSSYGVCWFDWLPPADAARVRSLPARDQAMGRTSDYCR